MDRIPNKYLQNSKFRIEIVLINLLSIVYYNVTSIGYIADRSYRNGVNLKKGQAEWLESGLNGQVFPLLLFYS